MTSSAGIQIRPRSAHRRGTFHLYTVDTGSLGVLVPQSQVPAVNLTPGETQVVGPAGPGVKYYDSNGGHTFHGQYWLAPVTFLLSDGTTTVSTHPIKILVLPNADPLYYMGIGFDRNSTKRGDYFNSPADNAFLNVTDGLAHGSDVSPGYTITPNLITLGVTSAAGIPYHRALSQSVRAGRLCRRRRMFQFPGAAGQLLWHDADGYRDRRYVPQPAPECAACRA